MSDQTSELNEGELYNTIRQGSYVETVERGHVFAILGAEARAIVDAEEFSAEALPGDDEQVSLLVERPLGDYWAASARKADKLAYFDALKALAEEGGEVTGVFVGQNRGGLSVDAGVRAFVPWSHVDIHRVEDASPYLGKEATFEVLDFDEEKCELVLSRRNLLRRERDRARAETVASLEAGQVFTGVVRSIKKYGAFVDIGGLEGLLHVSNMSWGRIDHPSELVRPGDELRVVVLDYDAKRDRLSLGRKQLLDDPWEDISSRYEVGATAQGTVVSLADFGAFVELEPGLEGLVHVTELAWIGRINHPRDVLEIGQSVGVKVIDVDAENRRMSLSIKQLERNPWEALADDIEVGARLTGPVRNVTDFGAFVEVAPGIEGLVHASNVSWSNERVDPREVFKVGEELEVMVLGLDVEAQRLELGIKQLESNPWEDAAAIARPGKKIEVTITRVEDFGAFARVVEGVEGLIHISELSEDRVEDVLRVVRPGQTVEALVLSFDRGNERVSLSLKRDALEDEGMRSYSDDGSATSTLGDILREQLGLSAGEEE